MDGIYIKLYIWEAYFKKHIFLILNLFKSPIKQLSQKRESYRNIIYRVVKGGGPRGGGSLIFPKVPQSSLGILRIPQLPPPWTPPLRNPTNHTLSAEVKLPSFLNVKWVISFWFPALKVAEGRGKWEFVLVFFDVSANKSWLIIEETSFLR